MKRFSRLYEDTDVRKSISTNRDAVSFTDSLYVNLQNDDLIAHLTADNDSWPTFDNSGVFGSIYDINIIIDSLL